jgi:phage terminase small subunit
VPVHSGVTPAPPIPLSGEALAFWARHAGRLAAAGILTDADRESFAVLCLTWAKVLTLSAFEPGAGHYREMVQLTNLLKQYQALARQFGLLPRERRAAKMDAEPPPPRDEFGL